MGIIRGKRHERIRNIVSLIFLFLIGGCSRYEITVTQQIEQKAIFDNNVVLCYSKDLEWTKKLAVQYAKTRFNHFVVVIINSDICGDIWFGFPDNKDPIDIETLSLMLYLEYKDYDILLFIDNPTKQKLLTPRTWYFEKGIWYKDTKFNMWDAVTQQGYK